MLCHTSSAGLTLSPVPPLKSDWSLFRPHLGSHIAEVSPEYIYTFTHTYQQLKKKEHEFEGDEGYMGGVTAKKEKEKMV